MSDTDTPTLDRILFASAKSTDEMLLIYVVDPDAEELEVLEMKEVTKPAALCFTRYMTRKYPEGLYANVILDGTVYEIHVNKVEVQ